MILATQVIEFLLALLRDVLNGFIDAFHCFLKTEKAIKLLIYAYKHARDVYIAICFCFNGSLPRSFAVLRVGHRQGFLKSSPFILYVISETLEHGPKWYEKSQSVHVNAQECTRNGSLQLRQPVLEALSPSLDIVRVVGFGFSSTSPESSNTRSKNEVHMSFTCRVKHFNTVVRRITLQKAENHYRKGQGHSGSEVRQCFFSDANIYLVWTQWLLSLKITLVECYVTS